MTVFMAVRGQNTCADRIEYIGFGSAYAICEAQLPPRRGNTRVMHDIDKVRSFLNSELGLRIPGAVRAWYWRGNKEQQIEDITIIEIDAI